MKLLQKTKLTSTGQEDKKMKNNMMELNLEEMNAVSGSAARNSASGSTTFLTGRALS